MIFEKKTNKCGVIDVRVKFDGVSDIVGFVSNWREDEKKPEFRNVSERREYFDERREFNGDKNVEDVAKDLDNPMIEMAGAIETGDAMASDEIGSEIPLSRRRRARRLDDGDEVDVDRWIDRSPDMWEEMRRENVSSRVVRLYVNMSTSCDQGKNQFKWRTSTVVAIARILEDSRIPCEIIGAFTADGLFCWKSSFVQVEFPIKRAEQLLDIETIAYCAGHIAFFRSIGICTLIKICDLAKETSTGSLGCPVRINRDNEDDFVVSKDVLNEDDARKEVKRFVEWFTGNGKGE